MSKFSIKKIFFYNVINLICLSVINTEDIVDDVDLSSSLESMSKERYNFTSKEKPVKRTIENIPDSTSENDLIDLKDNFNSKNIFLDNNSSDKELEFPIETLQSKPKIVAATYSDFPFTVSIQKRGSHYASGAFVHKLWILSVAEPFYNVRESIKLYKARLGSVNCKKGGILVHLKGIEIHPQYEYGLPHFDIGLLRIANAVTDVTKTVAPASLWVSSLEEDDLNTMYWSTYWPRLIVQGNVLSSLANERYEKNIMHISYQRSITRRNCKDILEKMNVALDNSSICLEPITSHHSRCLPDPGAPVVTDNYLWGITSGWTSENCLKRRSPTLVTAVSSLPVISWISNFLDVSTTSDKKNSV